ncbi:MAG TPA: HipA N-terminal domain-containing protein [Candidatus Phocaeicola excrementigallinarum]|nr:HipA N-terminal domain-containing protein [Candidatus Phocaeicola excrementigallinarum]
MLEVKVPEKLFQGLPSFLADSLPDRWGNLVFERWASENHIPKRKLTSVDKLSFIGRRGITFFVHKKNAEAFFKNASTF